MSPGTRTILRRALVLPAITYVLWCAALYWRQDALLFPRSFANNQAMLRRPAEAEQWLLDIGDGKTVEAWFFLGDGRSAERPGPAAMLFHGNAELIDNWVGLADFYTRRGVSVLMPEYRGYGRSGGEPSQAAIARDVLAFHERLLGHAAVDSTRIAYHGRSLGGGVAVQLAKDRPPAALILDHTFTSVRSFASGFGVPGFLVKHPYDSAAVFPALVCPILITHGRDDRVVPFSHGLTLSTLNPRVTFREVPGDHINFPGDMNAYDAARELVLREAGLID